MKVALVSAYCLESSMSLGKYMADEGAEVHLYGIMPYYNQNVYVADFSKNKQSCGFIKDEIAFGEMGESLSGYLSNIKTRFYVYPAGAGRKAFFSDIYYAWKFKNELLAKKFDVIHLIHTGNRFSLLLLKLLKGENLLQTLHEVTAHEGVTSKVNVKILKTLIKNSIPIIFNSVASKNRFLSFRASVENSPVDERLYKMIKFGLFEIYNHTPQNLVQQNSVNHSIPVILHFGRIVKYKGIDILLDAIKIIQKYQPVHLVIAGGGEPYFTFDGIESYEFLNYTLSNSEIIDLIKKCSLVVCPYTSASQSGIPMTVYLHNKPIVASDVGGFSEMIDHEITGLLVNKIDAPSFAEAIQLIISDQNVEKKMIENIKTKYNTGEFAWSNIAKETIRFYKSSLKMNLL